MVCVCGVIREAMSVALEARVWWCEKDHDEAR